MRTSEDRCTCNADMSGVENCPAHWKPREARVDPPAARGFGWVPARGAIRTYPTGFLVTPTAPATGTIFIEDIAHALAHECRFGGHVREHYSVAQHCVLVSWHVLPHLRLEALLHDAAEAYLKDIPRPFKKDPAMSGYRATEKIFETAIAARFGLHTWDSPEVHDIDMVVCAAEQRDLTKQPEGLRNPLAFHFRGSVVPWSSQEARAMYLRRFADLYLEDTRNGAGVCRTCGGVLVVCSGPTAATSIEPLIGGYWRRVCGDCGGDLEHREVRVDLGDVP